MTDRKKGFILNNIMDNILNNNKKVSKISMDESKKYNGILPKIQLDKLQHKKGLSNQNPIGTSAQNIYNKKEYLVRQNLITEADMNNYKKQDDN